MSWTQPICGECWERENPGRKPVRVIDGDTERCCHCGTLTTNGIYTRVDPTTVAFPRDEATS
jgi:hypothetical protein